MAAFSVCIGSAPKVAGAYYNRALAYVGQESYDLALRDYGHALRVDPTFAQAALNRGMLLFKLKRFAEAEGDLRLALRLGASAVVVHYNRAMVQQKLQDVRGALQSVEKVLTLDPDHLEARRLRNHLRKKQ